MSLREYEDFFYSACLVSDGDPVTAWERQSDDVRRLAEWIDGRSEVHIKAPGTDLTLGVEGRLWIPCAGEHNMPDGEFFTGPIEDSVNGTVSFSFPAGYGGREVEGVRFEFKDGKVVDASAARGEEFLIEMLNTDDGARRLGEIGIGTNFGIATGTREILLDEKIGGTVHLAIGMSYPETGGENSSAVHWDMVCDLREGGSLTVDGEELQRDGRFLVCSGPAGPATRRDGTRPITVEPVVADAPVHHDPLDERRAAAHHARLSWRQPLPARSARGGVAHPPARPAPARHEAVRRPGGATHDEPPAAHADASHGERRRRLRRADRARRRRGPIRRTAARPRAAVSRAAAAAAASWRPSA